MKLFHDDKKPTFQNLWTKAIRPRTERYKFERNIENIPRYYFTDISIL